MRNLGVHAGLALAGIIAGLPAAAVVQWNREPPGVVWSRAGRVLFGEAGDDSSVLLGPSHQFAAGPGGPRVTSLIPGGGFGASGSFHLTDVVQAPGALSVFGMKVVRVRPKRRWVVDEAPQAVTVDGVTWHRIALSNLP